MTAAPASLCDTANSTRRIVGSSILAQVIVYALEILVRGECRDTGPEVIGQDRERKLRWPAAAVSEFKPARRVIVQVAPPIKLPAVDGYDYALRPTMADVDFCCHFAPPSVMSSGAKVAILC